MSNLVALLCLAGKSGLIMVGLGEASLTAFLTMSGILLPSAILTYSTVRWLHSNETNRHVIAFKQGLMPVVIAVLLTSSWVLFGLWCDYWVVLVLKFSPSLRFG